MEFEITVKYKIEAESITYAIDYATEYTKLGLQGDSKAQYKIEGDNQIITWEEK